MGRYRRLVVSAVLLALLAALSGGGAAVLAQGQDDDIPDPGPPPRGMAVKVFIHYAREHGKPQDTDVTTAGATDDPSYSFSGVRWQDPNGTDNLGIPYLVNPNFGAKKSATLTRTAAQGAIGESFNAWVSAQDANVVSANGRLLYKDAGLTTISGGKYDKKNVVSWRGLRINYVAVTYVWYYTATKYIAEFDILLNDSYPWTYTPPEVPEGTYDPISGIYGDPVNLGVASTYDVRDIMTHEAGHTLMLGDLYESVQADLTMYGYASYGELKKDTLGKGDFLGLNYIY